MWKVRLLPYYSVCNRECKGLGQICWKKPLFQQFSNGGTLWASGEGSRVTFWLSSKKLYNAWCNDKHRYKRDLRK